MPVSRARKLGKSLAGAVLAASLIVAPLVTSGASATDLVGTVGELVEWTPETNKPSYWEGLTEHPSECYSHEGDSSHGSITDDAKTVTLNEYDESWPGDHWELLVVKGGSDWNNVIVHPEAGVAYASPTNSGGKQSAVSHWIVCKGTAPTTVVPTLTFTLPTCDTAGQITMSENVTWTSTSNPDGSTLWKAVALAGQKLAEGAQSEWLVPNLAKLAADLELCRPEQPPAKQTSVVSHDFDCDSTTVTTTTVTTTTPFVWVGGAWVEGEPTDSTATAERPMTAAEKKDCPLPDTEIEYSEWTDGEWECGDTQVTQTREVTTTVYSYDEQAQPTATSTVALETQTRPLTQAEIGECPLVPGDIASACVGDVPFLDYGVTLPEGLVADSATPVTITFVNPAGDDYVIENQPLSGTVLWPGASAEEPKMWPGWELVDGEYFPTDGNFAWTREGVTVRFEVNPSYETTIEYPAATALCANPPFAPGVGGEEPGVVGGESPAAGGEEPALAVTGTTVPVWAIGGAAAAILAGVALTAFAVMRRRTHTS